MINSILLIVFSLLNIVGLFLWAWTSMVMIEVILCRDVKQMTFTFTNLFSRKTCITIRLYLKRFKRSLRNTVYLASLLFLVGSYAAIFHRLYELSTHVTSPVELGRAIAALCIPSGLILLYRSFGYKVSFM